MGEAYCAVGCSNRFINGSGVHFYSSISAPVRDAEPRNAWHGMTHGCNVIHEEMEPCDDERTGKPNYLFVAY